MTVSALLSHARSLARSLARSPAGCLARCLARCLDHSRALAAALLCIALAPSQACEASYSPAADSLTVPCVQVDSTGARYSATLKRSQGGDFSLVSSQLQTMRDATISDVQIVTRPYPVVLAFIELSDPCGAVREPIAATLDPTQRRIAIKIQSYSTAAPNVLCAATVVSTARAFPFKISYVPGGNNTYTVEVNGTVKTFDVPAP